ncbi:hypothetical protein STENOSP10_30220 [Stenotrophomonas sepilia]|uniref:Uncharacterized protein n=1 Tax=Stenotrophomonas sepilia TaxID=2860290 RepID=A0ABQ6QGW2_9GAMM|nr:hypothetical protein STENOSP10_30220 [Stenotrophomonas sepilia]
MLRNEGRRPQQALASRRAAAGRRAGPGAARSAARTRGRARPLMLVSACVGISGAASPRGPMDAHAPPVGRWSGRSGGNTGPKRCAQRRPAGAGQRGTPGMRFTGCHRQAVSPCPSPGDVAGMAGHVGGQVGADRRRSWPPNSAVGRRRTAISRAPVARVRKRHPWVALSCVSVRRRLGRCPSNVRPSHGSRRHESGDKAEQERERNRPCNQISSTKRQGVQTPNTNKGVARDAVGHSGQRNPQIGFAHEMEYRFHHAFGHRKAPAECVDTNPSQYQKLRPTLSAPPFSTADRMRLTASRREVAVAQPTQSSQQASSPVAAETR